MEILQAPEVFEAYAFANTPSYLYRKLRSSQYVQSLSADSTQRLIRDFSSGAISEDAGSIALAYAYLVALLLKHYDTNKLRQLPGYSYLPWAEALITIHASKPPAPVVTKVIFPKVSQVNTVNTSQSPSIAPGSATVARVKADV
jgi:hypothetical protein